MKKQKTTSFQENIRNTFIAYSLVPVFVVICLAFVLSVCSWRYTVIHYNQLDNQEICSQLDQVITAFSRTLDDISACDIVYGQKETQVDKATANLLYDKLYQLKNDKQYHGSFYLLNDKQHVIFSFGADIFPGITSPEYGKWGILKQLGVGNDEKSKELEGTTASLEKNDSTDYVYVVLQQGVLFIGRNMVNPSTKETMHLIFALSAADCSENISVKNRQFIITDKMGWIYYTNRNGLRDNLSRIQDVLRSQNGFLNYEGHTYYVTSQTLEDVGMCVYTISDTQMSRNVIFLMIIVVLIIFLGLGIFTFYSTKRMSVKYTQDIDAIAKAFEKVEKGDLEVKLHTESSTEFQAIGKDFNLMIDGLKHQIEQNQEMAEHVAFAQVKQLESQFNPHFLFNTLDNIRFMTKIDLKAADKMIVSLSHLLRYSIREVREELTVREDLDNLQSYFNILQIRFNKRFSYEIDIEERIMQCLIPKLLIQPLIENAVKYGFIGQETLHVIIRGYEKQGKLIVICQDDGAGMEAELLEEIREQLKQDRNSSTHMGLYNIHRRIRLLYKEDYGMRIESAPGEGTTIVLTMPYHI